MVNKQVHDSKLHVHIILDRLVELVDTHIGDDPDPDLFFFKIKFDFWGFFFSVIFLASYSQYSPLTRTWTLFSPFSISNHRIP